MDLASRPSLDRPIALYRHIWRLPPGLHSTALTSRVQIHRPPSSRCPAPAVPPTQPSRPRKPGDYEFELAEQVTRVDLTYLRLSKQTPPAAAVCDVGNYLLYIFFNFKICRLPGPPGTDR
jgi:hypothetical protein